MFKYFRDHDNACYECETEDEALCKAFTDIEIPLANPNRIEKDGKELYNKDDIVAKYQEWCTRHHKKWTYNNN